MSDQTEWPPDVDKMPPSYPNYRLRGREIMRLREANAELLALLKQWYVPYACGCGDVEACIYCRTRAAIQKAEGR